MVHGVGERIQVMGMISSGFKALVRVSSSEDRKGERVLDLSEQRAPSTGVPS